MSEKRGIAADRQKLTELHWGGWYEPTALAPFAEEVLPHYLSRCEEDEAALEAACREYAGYACPPGLYPHHPDCHNPEGSEGDFKVCVACCRSYFEQQGKEAAKDDRGRNPAS